jgi:hypothetical protein
VVLGPEVDEGKAARSLDRLHKIGEEDLGGGIEPVEVLEHREHRLPRALGMGESLHQSEQPALARLGVHPL